MRIRQLQPHQVKLRQELRDSVKKKHGQGNEEGLKPPQKELKLNNPQLNERQQQFEKRRAETQKHRSIGEKPAEGSNIAPGANTPTDKTPKRTLAPQLPRQRRNAN